MKRSVYSPVPEDDVRSEKIERAGPSIQAFLRACGYTEKLQEERVLVLWSEMAARHLGPTARAFSRAKGMREGQLIVEVSKAAWRHRLALEVPALILAINEELGSDAVTSIRLV